MAELVMPRLSDTMEEGTILRWLKTDGDEIQRGDELVEIETDKANMIYESDLSGTLQTVAAEGDTLPVGQLIARVGVPGDGAAATGGQAAGEHGPSDTPVASPASAAQEPVVASGASDVPAPAGDGARAKASPLARRIARDRGVDLHALSGSGPGGRIVKADVEAAGGSAAAGPDSARAPATGPNAPSPPAGAAAPAPATATAREDVTTAKGETTDVALTRMQQTIARRMAESKATIPDFTLLADVDMQECVRLRGELKRISKDEAPTYNDMVVKACALALREQPRANGSYRDGALQLHSRINVGVAVAAQDALVVPTVFDADAKALGEIARETRSLAARVRDATITPPELGGGTFTVSNLGMYGIKSFTAIINPPQAAILSVGAVQQRAVVRDDEVVARHTMTLTLVCDHRVLYGADAAELLARIRELLQAPAALTL
ncbi:MAG TPA: dihydrolipoamide acetyltransferase family protein [Solirubrobacteraceae bacterium]|nr:dihydrolipoamide acetyltransferase family protein [Solirubrobacteraceae bacterium]